MTVQCLTCGALREPDPSHAATTPCPDCQHYGWVYPPGAFPVPLDRAGIWGQLDHVNVLPFYRSASGRVA